MHRIVAMQQPSSRRSRWRATPRAAGQRPYHRPTGRFRPIELIAPDGAADEMGAPTSNDRVYTEPDARPIAIPG
jgi:hypothetical protein